VAYLTDDPNLKIDPPGDGASAEYTHYDLQSFDVRVSATGNNLLFLSESYYPNGWKAFLDGQEIPIYRLDYLFRGVVVPKGEHMLTMKFEPKTFIIGRDVSLAANITLLAALFGVSGFDWWRKRKERSSAQIPPANS
ncbi:MAG TPA: YfhO family protein, partial [Terriglobia bacterium]|nr:YfhO family protein [Terriglobia bacterium]